jgi:hypothetical protein
MNTCGSCPRRPAATAHHAGARKGPRGGLTRQKAPRSRGNRRIDVLRRSRDHATGTGRATSGNCCRESVNPYPAADERCQRARIDGGTFGRKSLGALFPAHARRANRVCRRVRSRQTRRQARSRRRSDDRKVVRRRSNAKGESLRRKGGLEVERRWVFHGARRAVSGRGVSDGCS